MTQKMPILKWTWTCITIDVMVDLPTTLDKFDFIWAIIDRLTKLAHLCRSRLTTIFRDWLRSTLQR